MSHSSSSSNLQIYEQDRTAQEDPNESIRKTVAQIYMSSVAQMKLINLEDADFDETWRLHYANARNHIDGNVETVTKTNVLKSFYLVRKLFRVVRSEFAALVAQFKSLKYRHKTVRSIQEHFGEISSQIGRVNIEFCCPLVFFDQENLHFSLREFYDNHVTTVVKIGSNYDAFIQSINQISTVNYY
jgi:hypothetical protein